MVVAALPQSVMVKGRQACELFAHWVSSRLSASAATVGERRLAEEHGALPEQCVHAIGASEFHVLLYISEAERTLECHIQSGI